MSLLRTVLLTGISLSLMACSSDEKDKYDGPPALNEGQKLEAGVAVSKLNMAERVTEAIDGTKEVDQDIAELVTLIQQNCSIERESGGDQDNGFSETKVVGGECPVSINISHTWRSVSVDGDVYLDVTSETQYQGLTTEALSLLDVSFATFTARLPAGGWPTFKAQVDFHSGGGLSIDDSLSGILLPNGKIQATYFRKMRVNGFDIEARVIMTFRVESNGDEDELVLEKLDMFVNGQRVTTEEMASLFPDAFGDFDTQYMMKALL